MTLESSGASESTPATGSESSAASSGGAGSFDAESFLAQHRAETEKLHGELKSTKSTLSRLHKAFAGDEEKGGDSVEGQISEVHDEIERLKDLGRRAQAEGYAIPETIKIGLKQQEMLLKNLETEKRLSAHEHSIKTMGDMDFQRNQDAFKTIDATVANTLDQLYGHDKKYDVEKVHMARSITARLQLEVENLMKTDPDYWNMIRKQPEALKKIAVAQAQNSMPPAFKQMIETQRLKDTPVSLDDMAKAMQEAKKITDPKMREKVTSKIRQDYWSEKFSNPRSRKR